MKPSRLRRGEVVAGVGAVALLALMFLVPWYGGGRSAGVGRGRGDTNGWTGLPVVRWLILVAVIAGIVLVATQATREAPALPVTMSVIVTVLGGLTVLALVYELLANAGSPQPGAYIGVLGAAAIAGGGFRSLRQEDGWVPGPDRQIECVSLSRPEA